MKRKIIITSFLVVFVLIFVFLVKFGRREIVYLQKPSDGDYYIKIYQIGYYLSCEYQCLCVLYGPDGVISKEYFNAISIESGYTYMKEGYNIFTCWMDEYVSVSVREGDLGEVEIRYYIDGRIIRTKRN